MIYLDHAATTAVREEVLFEMLPYFSNQYGNASSLYSIGRSSKIAIENARLKVARAINANQKEIYFTSGGSESNNLALKGICYLNKNKKKHIITSKIEHPSVLNTCKSLENDGFEVTYLNVDSEGFISLEELENRIKDNTVLISIMFANNEIGTIQNIEKIGKIARKYNVLFHTDCVQAVGNELIDVKKMNIDLLSMSAHKFYGPKGVGALFVRNGIDFFKIQDGGHQEKNKRAGTENVSGIVGLGKAIELAYKDYNYEKLRITDLRDYCIDEIFKRFSNVKLNGSRNNRLAGNVNVSFRNINSEELLLKLDEKGICVSVGSACSSGIQEPSHVLTSIGLMKEYLSGTLRITIGMENTKKDIDLFLDNLEKIINSIKTK